MMLTAVCASSRQIKNYASAVTFTGPGIAKSLDY